MPLTHRKDFLVPLLTVLSDAIAIETAFLFSYWLRFYSPLTGSFPVELGLPPLDAYVYGSCVVIPIWLLLFNSRRMYSPRRVVYFSDEFFAIVRIVVFGMLIVMSAAFFYRAFSYSRLVFFLLGVSSIAFISAGRFIVLKFEQSRYRRGNDVQQVLLVGTNAFAARILQSIQLNPKLGYRVVGFCSIRGKGKLVSPGVRRLGSIEKVPSLIKALGIDIVLIALNTADHLKLYELVKQCEGLNTELMMVPDTLELMTNQVRIKEIEGIPFIKIKAVPMTTWNRILKRAFDLAVAVIVLIIISPVFLLLCILIKFDSKGPVFFWQERVGLDGQPFAVIKFRSMRTDAEKETGPVFAQKDDTRTTGLGRLLRRFSLDELPQLLNVIKGEMSLVGPRPERPHFVEKFKKDIPKYLDRHRVKTGMTGWAQVNGLRGNAPIDERTKYDIYYIENWSLVFDLKIILKTIRAVLFAADAY
jgi:exopolysaccharide biosynthesis polyprenyl glycosylphosphotransferase